MIERVSDDPKVKKIAHIKVFMPWLPFLQKLRKKKFDEQFEKFIDMLKKLHINIQFINAIRQILMYAKFLKDISKKRKGPN